MSQRAYIDVLLEIPTHETARLADPSADIWQRLRTKAEQDCREAGATLRTDSRVEVIVKQAHSALIGDITLVASRWPVDVPDTVARAL